MTVTFHKLSIVGAVLVLLAGCASVGDMPGAGQWSAEPNEGLVKTEDSSALEVCDPEAGSPFHFRKVVLVAGTLGAPALARDLPGLALLTSQRLQTHLDELERFNVLAMHDASFDSMAPSTAGHVKQLGRDYSSQFVVKLELEDLTVHSSGGWLRRVIGGGKTRNVLMRLYIHGTEYGTLFHSQLFQDTVSGNVLGFPGGGHTVATPWFNTDLGRKIDEVLKDMSVQINEKLACVPFSTNITAIEDNNIRINAGYLHGLRPGATLRVYQSRDFLVPEVINKASQSEIWIKVKKVFPNYSIAGIAQEDADGERLDIGDIVRAW